MCDSLDTSAPGFARRRQAHVPTQTTKQTRKRKRGGRGVCADPLANRPAHTAARLFFFAP